MITEIWNDIAGYEGFYQISDWGRVKSLARRIEHACGCKNIKERLLNPIINTGGYACVILSKNAVREQMRVHRIVAMHFIKNPDNKPVTNHKDGNKLNNEVANLEWATESENTIHSYDTGLDPKRSLSKQKAAEIKSMLSTGVKKIDVSKVMNVRYEIVLQIAYGKTYKTA